MSTLPASDDPAVDRCEDDPTITIAKREEIQRMMAEIERLPLPVRQVLMHFYYEDCTYKQIAEQLGISTATVNFRLTTARQLLRERLVQNLQQR